MSTWLHLFVFFLVYPQIPCLIGGIVTLVAFVRLFSTVCFQMSFQIACMRGSKVTLVAFVCFLPTMWFQMLYSHWLHLFNFSPLCVFILRFHMSLQVVCPRGCIVILVAFVQLFPTVHFQMCPQMACLKRGIVTLVAFI